MRDQNLTKAAVLTADITTAYQTGKKSTSAIIKKGSGINAIHRRTSDAKNMRRGDNDEN